MYDSLFSGETLISSIPNIFAWGVAAIGLYYYISFHVEEKQPRIVHGESEVNEYVLNNCKNIKSSFIPSFLLCNTHVQTILPNLVTLSSNVKFKREFLPMTDGQMLALDYPYLTEEGDANETEADTPILLMLPGLTGHAEGISSTCYHGIKNNYKPIVFNKRGHGNSKITVPKLQSFGDPSDLRQVLLHLQKTHPNAVLTGIGISAGSGLLVSYLGTYTSDPIIKVGVCISPGYDAVTLFSGGLGFPYDSILMRSLKRLIGQHVPTLSQAINMEPVMQAKHLGELEERFYCKLYGYKNITEYWIDNNPMTNVAKITVPMLCINSSDDPICLKSNIPYDFFKEKSQAMLVNPERGGHCGFLSGSNLETWADTLAVSYIQTVLEFQRQK